METFEVFSYNTNSIRTSLLQQSAISNWDKRYRVYKTFDKNYHLKFLIEESQEPCKVMYLFEITDLYNEILLFHVSTLHKKYDEKKVAFLTTHKRNNSKLIPLGIQKRESGDNIYFELQIAPRKLLSNQTMELDICDICYNEHVQRYADTCFNCDHNSFCKQCVNSILQKSENPRCPLCRAVSVVT